MRIKGADKVKHQKDRYVPHKLRSRPFRCISLPILCLALNIFYWFMWCPLIYYLVHFNYVHHHKNDWTVHWPYYFCVVALLIFILLLALLVCLWRCRTKEETTAEIKARQKEFDSLLTEAIEYNSLKNTTHRRYSLNDEIESKEFDCKTASKETIDDQNFTLINVQELKMGAGQSLPQTEIPMKEKKVEDDSMVKDIEKLFPRCSVKRKVEVKKRPDTLILSSPTIKETETRRHTMKEMHSPLTPREIFFFDLIQSANKHDSNITLNFIENERKHSSNNFVGSSKPEIKDFILKKRPDSSSSPEYFIANVGTPKSCTAEAFLFVDGGNAETKFKITKVADSDGGDDVVAKK